MNQDYKAFQQAGLVDIYEKVGSCNLFMTCESPNAAAFRELSSRYRFRLCRNDELDVWMHTAVDAPYVKYAADYYRRVYEKSASEFFRRCTFVCDENDNPVATGFIWKSYGLINTLAWLRVVLEHEGKGLGRALITEVLRNTSFPVYLHTQPSSVKAIKLYSDFGFKLITDPVIGYRKNDLEKSLPIMKKVMPQSDYENLQFTLADNALLKAALSNEAAEF